MKLILLRSCRAGTHFSVRGKVGKRRKGGGVSTPPLLTPPPQRPKGVPPLEFSASPRIALLWSFFKSFLFLHPSQCFSKRPRRANESFRPPFSKGGGFQRQSLWARPAGRETLFRLIRIRRGAPTVRWTVGVWGTLSRGSPMGRGAAHFIFYLCEYSQNASKHAPRPCLPAKNICPGPETPPVISSVSPKRASPKKPI